MGRPRRVYREELKERFTGHWDLDYVSREELERDFSEGRRRAREYKTRQFLIITLVLLLMCLFPTLLASLSRIGAMMF